MDTGVTALGGLIAGSVVAVALGAFKAIERAWTRSKADGAEDEPDFGAKDREHLNTVAAIVKRTDAEGVPLSYVPRRLVKLAENQTELMRTMAELVRQQTGLSKTLHEHMTSHQRREEEELKKIRTVLEGLT